MKTKCCDCCCPEIINSEACGCCEGIEIITPLSTNNRPGLSELSYRIGAHADFLETMIARLSSSDYPELAKLTTRNADDPSIALLDAWATVADVLTFYQERIANEGYLRTATERRSILELARLVGYKLRPGVAASVFLAFTIDENTQEETTIPIGSRVQSIPGPDELPQIFETSEDIKARMQWNNLKPRLTQPQTQESIKKGTPDSAIKGPRVYLKGINTNLKPNDPLLIDFDEDRPIFSRVIDVFPDAIADRTLVTLVLDGISDDVSASSSTEVVLDDVQLIKDLTKRPSIQRRNSLQLERALGEQFMSKANTGYGVAGAFVPELQETLFTAVGNATATKSSTIKVYSLRVEASLFGHNAPREPQYEPKVKPGSSTPNEKAGNLMPQLSWPEWRPDGESGNVLFLDRTYDQILQGSFLVVQKIDKSMVFQVDSVNLISRSAYGLNSETTKLTLNESDEWWNPDPNKGFIDEIRTTKVYAQPELLELANEPIEIEVCGGEDFPIELDGFYDGLESGRWVIVSGEREIAGTSGVRFSELAMLSSVTQQVSKEDSETLPGEKIHTYIKLAEKLAYCFKRDTVTIYGNVVKASHGDTRKEILGSGDGSKALQSFDLKQQPLTFVSASNPSGVDSTLSVFVNDIRWHESVTLADRQATDRNFITQTDNEDKTRIIFGNGNKGARLPTGIENIRTEFRAGIGKPGNIKARQISLLMDKPLGVKEVINPLRASGGANRERRDQARKNAPLAIKALDRLVSVQDYEDFARVYAGIGKAHALELSNGRQQLVHVTIAGAEDIPIEQTSDLFRNLGRALHDFGDPHQALQLAIRELMFIFIEARVAVLPDYQWEPVVTALRNSLLEAFSFEQRELGQDVMLSEIIQVMQGVRGVAYVDVDAFGGIPEKIADAEGGRRLLTPDEISQAVDCQTFAWSHDDMEEFCTNNNDTSGTDFDECNKFENCNKYGNLATKSGVRQRLQVNLAQFELEGSIRPAQIAFLSPDVPATLILNPIESLS